MLAAQPKRSKYGAKKVELDGHTFASKAESKRYVELKILLRAGEISDLELQPKFELAPSVKFTGAARATPALRYVADFAYTDRNLRRIVEDVKGFRTELYRAKRHLMLAVHGIEVQEVRKK